MKKKNSIDFKLLKRVLTEAAPYKILFLVAFSFAILLAVLTTVRPYLIKVMVDDYIFQYDLNGMTKILLLVLGVLILNSVIQYLFIYDINLLGQSVIRDLRIKVFNHINSRKLRYFDTTPIGKSTTRVINDIETINSIFTQGVITIISDLLTVFTVLTIMFVTSWRLSLIILVTMPLLVYATYIFKEKVKASYTIVRNQIAEMNAFLQERISGMRIVQAFGAEDREMDTFKSINRSYTQANLNSILYYAVFFPVVEIISALSLGLMVWWGAKSSLQGLVSPGMLVAFPIYLNMLYRPIRMLADKFNTLQMGLIAAERVFDVLDNKDEIENKGTLLKEKLEGKVEFKSVDFAYDDKNYVLKDVSFSLKPNQTLAIVGSTGSGKSTIINLLSRFYEINGGEILVDERDIRSYELSSLRSKMAVVLQDVFLFSGTILENITLRNPEISEETVIEAAKMIGAHEFIARLPGGYSYEVQERGATLSMGQRQLVSFVRALVYDPNILILDEATSSIDPESEEIIQYAIEKLISKRTSIVIAHRLSTIRNADRVLVMDKGRIVENGNYDELLEIEEGYFKKLHDMQFLATK
jgi:ATP-binding cassette subfamily B multidrug efflux pump